MQLVPNAHYEDLDASAAGISPQKTIVVQCRGSKKMLIFGIFWATLWILIWGWFFYTIIYNPGVITLGGEYVNTSYGRYFVPSRDATLRDCILPVIVAIGFIGTGLGLIYFGTKTAFAKGWIAITKAAIYCMRGLSYNPKRYKKYPCKTPMAKVYQLPTSKVGDKQYYKIVLGGPDGSITFASGLCESDANGYRKMLQDLLDGKGYDDELEDIPDLESELS